MTRRADDLTIIREHQVDEGRCVAAVRLLLERAERRDRQAAAPTPIAPGEPIATDDPRAAELLDPTPAKAPKRQTKRSR